MLKCRPQWRDEKQILLQLQIFIFPYNEINVTVGVMYRILSVCGIATLAIRIKIGEMITNEICNKHWNRRIFGSE